MGLFHLNEESETNSNIKKIKKNDEQVNVQPKHSRIEHSIITLNECSINVTGRTFVHNFERNCQNIIQQFQNVPCQLY